MRRAIPRFLVVAGLVASFVPAASASDPHPESDRSGQGGFVSRSLEGDADGSSRWTKARMRKAKAAVLSSNGALRFIAPRVQEGSDPEFVRTEIEDASRLPYSAVGKIFAHDPEEDVDYSCSGAVIDSSIGSVVITAGHCLYYNGSFADQLEFVPGYRNGDKPFGGWKYESLYVPDDWGIEGDRRLDVGFVVVSPRRNGTTVSEAVGGSLPVAYNTPERQPYTIVGYPEEAPFDGERMHQCETAYVSSDPSRAPGRPHPIGARCDMTPGASGGPWLNSDGAVVSVFSYGEDGVVYGPYFSETIQAEFEEAATPRELAATITLSTEPRVKATGRVEAEDNEYWCQALRELSLQNRRSSSSSWKTVRRRNSFASGRFRFAIRDIRGDVRVVAPFYRIDQTLSCSRAVSPEGKARR